MRLEGALVALKFVAERSRRRVEADSDTVGLQFERCGTTCSNDATAPVGRVTFVASGRGACPENGELGHVHHAHDSGLTDQIAVELAIVKHGYQRPTSRR